MTVPNSLNKHTYAGNGLTIDFPYTFKIFKTTDIQVILTDIATGVDTILTTNYTVNTNTNTVRYPLSGTPLSSLFKITLNRKVPITQETTLPNGGPYFAKTIETSLDKGIIIEQQLQEQLSRALLNSVSTDDTVSNTLPSPVPLSSFRWDSTAKKLETTLDPATVMNLIIDARNDNEQDKILAEQAAEQARESAIEAANIVIGHSPSVNVGNYTAVIKIADSISKGPWADIRAFGATGEESFDATNALNDANNSSNQMLVTPGVHLITSDITFNKEVTFMEGALLKIRNCTVVFENGINCGWHKIFDTIDNFEADLKIDSSVIIKNCNVKADWFSLKVDNPELIKTIPDQTNNMLKAYRAAVGNFIPRNSSNSEYVTQYPQGVLELGQGYYRIDGTFAFGVVKTSPKPDVYYKVNGFKLIGQGANSSFLVRTNMQSLEYVLFAAFYTGELTIVKDFKIICYNPDGINSAQKYNSAARALIYCQGDSLHISNIWVSGAQTHIVDVNGIARNGVGFQFASCVDTYFNNLFVEYCVTGVAFGSSHVRGNNLELYNCLNQDIGIGVFMYEWGNDQQTSSNVAITGIISNSCHNYGITVIEKGVGDLHINGGMFDGYSSESGVYVGTQFTHIAPGATLAGSLTQCSISNFSESTFVLENNASLGTVTKQFSIDSSTIVNQNYNGGQFGVFNLYNTGSKCNLTVNKVSINLVSGILLAAPSVGSVTLRDISLSSYIGQSDTSSNRSLFISTGANVNLINITRNAADTTVLTQYGYAASGNVYIDIDYMPNATRIVTGGATVKMPSKVPFA